MQTIVEYSISPGKETKFSMLQGSKILSGRVKPDTSDARFYLIVLYVLTPIGEDLTEEKTVQSFRTFAHVPAGQWSFLFTAYSEVGEAFHVFEKMW